MDAEGQREGTTDGDTVGQMLKRGDTMKLMGRGAKIVTGGGKQGMTVGNWIWLAISSVVPLALLIVGAMHLHDCPIKPMIPKWMLITGAYTLIYSFVRTISSLFFAKDDASLVGKVLRLLGGLLSVFGLVWFILGSVWVYNTNPNYSATALSMYCHRGTYLFAFWVITIGYIMMAISVALVCCLCAVGCVAACCGSKN